MFSQTLKNQVEQTLDMYPETRNSDIALMIRLWKSFYPEFVLEGTVKLSDLYDLPREDNIKRVRAKIQNEEGRYLPTEWIIAKHRGINEEAWKKALGYYVEPNNQLRFA